MGITLEERMNHIFAQIEKLVNDKVDTPAIVREISASCGLHSRNMDAAFAFVTGYSLNAYAKERKLMVAYRQLIQSTSFDVESVLAYTEYDNQNSFGKRFKEIFNMTPKGAYRKKDMTLYKEPLSWNPLSSSVLQDTAPHPAEIKTHYGLSVEEYCLIEDALDKQAEYGLTDEQANLAFDLYRNYDVEEMDIAFNYVAQIISTCPTQKLSTQELYKRIYEYPDVMDKCLRDGMSYSEATYERLFEEFKVDLNNAAEAYQNHASNPYVDALLQSEEAVQACLQLDADLLIVAVNHRGEYYEDYAVFFELYRINEETGGGDFDCFLQWEYAEYLGEHGFLDEAQRLVHDFVWQDSIDSFEQEMKEKYGCIGNGSRSKAGK